MRPSNGRFLLPYFRLRNLIYRQIFKIFYGRKFAEFGSFCRVLFPEGIEGAENIYLGSDVLIASRSYLAARPIQDGKEVMLKIRDGVRIGRFNHIYATNSIDIGKRVMTANNVYIADNTHRFDDPSTPIFEQPLKQLSSVVIGEGTWIGHGACILGAKIGHNCVIGAGAVVRLNIPDHCVVVGAPARIVKRYDFTEQRWLPTTPDGVFQKNSV